MTQRKPLVAPEGKMLVIVGNRTFVNTPSSLTLSGGQFGNGQEFSIDAGREMELALG